MSKKAKVTIQDTGVDRLEIFLQHNIKSILYILLSLIILFIGVYFGYNMYQKSVNSKINKVGEVEISVKNKADAQKFAVLSLQAKNIKDYIALRSAIMFNSYDDNASAVSELKKTGGDYQELGAGMLFDLGQSKEVTKYLTGNMRELWYYRQVLASTPETKAKNIELFKSLYPNSRLLTMVENWNN